MYRIFFALSLLCASGSTALAQDALKVDSKHHTALFENDQARVLKVMYNPKEKSVMHEHAPHVLIFLEDAQATSTLSNGRVVNASGKVGEVRFNESVTHSVENTGNKPAQVILVELKPRPALTSKPLTLDPVKVDPDRHKVEYEDDRVRVLRIKLRPHDKSNEHEHPNGIAVYLTGVDLKFVAAGGKSRKARGKKGEVTWAPPERHTVENLDDKPAEIILIELKR